MNVATLKSACAKVPTYLSVMSMYDALVDNFREDALWMCLTEQTKWCLNFGNYVKKCIFQTKNKTSKQTKNKKTNNKIKKQQWWFSLKTFQPVQTVSWDSRDFTNSHHWRAVWTKKQHQIFGLLLSLLRHNHRHDEACCLHLQPRVMQGCGEDWVKCIWIVSCKLV